MLERVLLPVLSPFLILRRHKSIRNNLTTLHRAMEPMARVRNQREAPDLGEEHLVIVRMACSPKRIRYVLEVVKVDIWTNKKKSMKGKSGFPRDNEIPDLWQKSACETFMSANFPMFTCRTTQVTCTSKSANADTMGKAASWNSCRT